MWLEADVNKCVLSLLLNESAELVCQIWKGKQITVCQEPLCVSK